jgi:hypothetical protein
VFVGALDLDPNLICHEMGHTLGLGHASALVPGDYGDIYCLMGAGRTFQNPRIAPSNWLVAGDTNANPISLHTRSGPGICAPYLYKLGWLQHIYWISFFRNPETDELFLGGGSLEGSIFANQGAPPVGSSRYIAILITSEARQFGGTPPNYWIEYRIPVGFDAGFTNGIVILREVGVNDQSMLKTTIPAIINGVISLPNIGYNLRVTEVDVPNQKIS